MALPLPPASNLHAILLITKSRSLGPRLVFHYPPLSPSAAALAAAKDPAWFRYGTTTGSAHSQDSDSDWDSMTGTDHDDDIEVGSRASGRPGSGRTGATGGSHHERDKHRLSAGVWGRHETIDEEVIDDDFDEKTGGIRRGGDHDWDTVLGFKTDALEKMLAPSIEFNKRRFELGVESVVFLGAPMFAREDGLWKKLRRKRKKQKEAKTNNGKEDPGSSNLSDDDESEMEDVSLKKTVPEPFVYPEGFEPGYGHDSMSATRSAAQSEAGSDARSTSTTHDNKTDMIMFNVVFVLNPPALEHRQRVKDMYDNVTRKYAKALKYEEARFQYVWKESKHILDIKQRAKEQNESLTATWKNIIKDSLLAKSLAIMFDAISHDKIAHIHFDATFNTSFQIPQADSTPYLPNSLEPQMPGLWLTTSNVMLENDEAPMTQHAALLLLEDTEILIKDLGNESSGNAAVIAFYLRSIVPTKSLLKISKRNNILARDMEYIASHLVNWRRARLIAPMSPRDTYIVSPNADLAALPAAMKAYAQRFPTISTLPKILGLLSGSPRPYRSFIPTAEHTEIYMDILAWLMRGGWVTQLRTFAWVRVTPEIKAQVAAEIQQEERMKREEEAKKELMSDNESAPDSSHSDKRSSLFSSGTVRSPTPLRKTWTKSDRGADVSEVTNSGMLGSRLVATSTQRGTLARGGSDAGSTSSQRTTIALNSSQRSESPQIGPKDTRPHVSSLLYLKPSSPRTSAASPTRAIDETPPPSAKDFKPSIILSPQKASSLEARWLEKIGQSFEEGDIIASNPSPPKNSDGAIGLTGKELRENWPMLLRHLDGRHAIEDVAPREGLKRKRVALYFNAVRDRKWLVVTRHW